jgi:hypothetical protein
MLYRDRTGVLAFGLLFVVSLYAVWDGHARLRAQIDAHRLLLEQEAQLERNAAGKAAASEEQLRGKTIGSVDRYVRHGPTHPQWVGATGRSAWLSCLRQRWDISAWACGLCRVTEI